MYPFWACPHHNSLPIQARITKFGPEVQNNLVKIPIVLGGNWPWLSDYQGQIWLKKSNLLVSPLQEIHNHYITESREYPTQDRGSKVTNVDPVLEGVTKQIPPVPLISHVFDNMKTLVYILLNITLILIGVAAA